MATGEPKSRAIVDKLLEVLPAGRMITLRYPRHKMDLNGPDPLTEIEAFGESPKARTGAHNDCFLASKADWGTYTNSIDREKEFYRQDNLFVPQGGETCNSNAEAQPFIGCENALRQLDELHFKTLNSGYERVCWTAGARAAACRKSSGGWDTVSGWSNRKPQPPQCAAVSSD